MKRSESKLKALAFFAIALSTSPYSYGDVISSETTKSQAALGFAYDSNKQQFIGSQCVHSSSLSPSFPSGSSQSGFNFSQSISQSQLSSELGFGLTGHASYGVTDYSMAASYFQQSVSNSFSISSSWESEYAFPNQIIDQPTPTAIGQSLRSNDERWNTTCGDQFVSQIVYGAKLFFSVRVDFKSESVKSAFQTKFSISGPAAGVGATLDQASKSFGQNATVTITAHQVGGDVSQVTDLFGSGDNSSVAPFMQCELGHFDQCSALLAKFISYATDVKSGFPSQLASQSKPGPAVLQYLTTPYTAIGLYPKSFPFLQQATILARGELSNEFKTQFNDSLAARRLLDQPSASSRAELIRAEQGKVDSNIAQILAVSEICYNTPAQCWTAVHALKLAQVDDEVLRLPTFAFLCKLSFRPEQRSLQIFMSSLSQSIGVANPATAADCLNLDQRAQMLTAVSLDGKKDNLSFEDLSPLGSLTSLKSLSIRHANVDDIIQLSPLMNLVNLDLSGNRISDLTPLANMTELSTLDLSDNDIVELVGIERLHRLGKLSLRNNAVKDVAELQGLKNLFWVDLRGDAVAFDAKKVSDLKLALSPVALVLTSNTSTDL